MKRFPVACLVVAPMVGGFLVGREAPRLKYPWLAPYRDLPPLNDPVERLVVLNLKVAKVNASWRGCIARPGVMMPTLLSRSPPMPLACDAPALGARGGLRVAGEKA